MTTLLKGSDTRIFLENMTRLKNYLAKSLRRAAEYTKRDAVERHLYRLKSVPRYTPGEISLFGNQVCYIDAASCLFMYQEIFKQQIYKFSSTHQNRLFLIVAQISA